MENQAVYMIPVPISDCSFEKIVPRGNEQIIKNLKYFIVENTRTARRFLKKLDPSINISDLTFYELNFHTSEKEIENYLDPVRKGESIGIMSEAGCPGVADPGAIVVRMAQKENFKVIPLVGPSSILMSLMASGLNGQKFSFVGYLPVENRERERAIRELENKSRRENMTQIFIETPYRNGKLMESLLYVLNDNTQLCVASDITSELNERIVTKTVKEWKSQGITLEKVPTIFLIYCA